ncbi:uncharacterized protein LOC106670386 isoform X2 [Cimex lectularius]|nr:uncharacterized protein LOC106670386 isoform X2 [Cimex lectularius]
MNELGTTNINKIKVSRFKKWIPVSPEEQYCTHFLIKNYNLSNRTVDSMYSPHALNTDSPLFNTSDYENAFIDDLSNLFTLISKFSSTSLNSKNSIMTSNTKLRSEKKLQSMTDDEVKFKFKLQNKKGKVQTKADLKINPLAKSESSQLKLTIEDSEDSISGFLHSQSLASKFKSKKPKSTIRKNKENVQIKKQETKVSSKSMRRRITFKKPGEKTSSKRHLDKSESEELLQSIDKHTSDTSIRSDPSYILAWNNSDFMVDVLKHSFLNRKYEKLSQIEIEHILCSRRNFFSEQGLIEKACIELLTACSTGDLLKVADLMNTYRLNINVSDNKGNSCVLRAAANDDTDMITLLMIFGADINTVNDEGFNALNHSLTRYLAILNSVSDWGETFLSPSSFSLGHQVKVWMKCAKKVKQDSIIEFIDELQGSEVSNPQRYIFHFPYPHQAVIATPGDISSSADKIKITEIEKFNQITETIKTIIEVGANVNLSPVPCGSLILAIYTENEQILEMILKAGVDTEQRLSQEEGELTALHILCLLQPKPVFPNMVKRLLEYGINPNTRTNCNFWEKELEFFHHGQFKTNFEIVGINPMHCLCLHSDVLKIKNKEILKQICAIIYPLSEKVLLYGHSYLSLAVAKGNIAVIESLLNLDADPNENIDPIWGNILTTYLKYQGSKSTTVAKLILSLLKSGGANPLHIVPMVNNPNGNTINYGLRLIQKHNQTTNPIADATAKQNLIMFLVTQGTENQKSWKNSNKDFNKKRKGAKQDTLHKRIIELQKFSREKVDKYLRGYIVRNLVNELKKQQCPSENTLKQLSWLNWDTFDKVLLTNIENGLVKIDIDIIERALNYVPRPLLPDEYVPPEQSQIKITGKKSQKKVGLSKFLDIIPSKMSIFSNESKISKISKMSKASKRSTFKIQKSESRLSITSGASKISKMSQKSQRSQRSIRHRGKRRSSQESFVSTRSVRHRGLKRKSSQDSFTSTKSFSFKPDKRGRRLSISGRTRSKTSIRTLEKSRHGSRMSFMPSMKDSTSQMSVFSHSRRRRKHGLTKEEQILALIISEKIQAIRDDIIQRYQNLISEKYSYSRVISILYKKDKITWNENLYPEIDTKDEIYKVCYTCLKRTEDLQLCTKCDLVYFCSLKCNIKDIMNFQSNHKCLCEFYGRVTPAYYKIKKDGCLSRIFTYRDSSEERFTEMKKLYGKGKKLQLSSKPSNLFKISKISISKRSRKNVHLSSSVRSMRERKTSATRGKTHKGKSKGRWGGRGKGKGKGKGKRKGKGKGKGTGSGRRQRSKRKHGSLARKMKINKSTITALSYRFGKGANKNLKIRMKNLKRGEKWRRGGQWRRMSSNEEQLLMRGIIKHTPKEKLAWYEKNADFLKRKPLTEYTPYQQLLLVLDNLFGEKFDVERYSPWVLSHCGAFFYKSQKKFEQGNYSLI